MSQATLCQRSSALKSSLRTSDSIKYPRAAVRNCLVRRRASLHRFRRLEGGATFVGSECPTRVGGGRGRASLYRRVR